MANQRFPAACATAMLCVNTCLGRTAFISPTGDDAAPGTRAEPWQTVGAANSRARPGDTVVFLPGEYVGTIAPALSGERGAPIVFRSDTRYGAVLKGSGGRRLAIDLRNRHDVEIGDFAVDTDGKGQWVYASEAHHISITGCRFVAARHTMEVVKCEQVRIVDCIFSKDQVNGNMISLRECAFVLFEGNSLSRVGHSPLQITTCRNVIVRANCFRNPWGRNYEFWASGRLLIEDNIVTQARDSAHSADSRAKNLYYDSINRFNRTFRNLHTPLNSLSYFPMGAKPTSYFREPFRLVNSRFCHNVVTENLGHGWEVGGINISSNTFANNIFYRNDLTASGVQLVASDRISRDNCWLHNLIAAREPGCRTVQHGSDHWTTSEANDRTGVIRGFWTAFGGNIDADPGFLAPDDDDWRIGPESPGVDAGMPLTVAIGSGTGRQLPVSDGRWFFDGFGVDGEVGDWIAIGAGDNLAQVARAELRYCQPAILHLDREVSWEDGTPVSLPWSGKAPDVGAYEVGGPHPRRFVAWARPARPLPGQNVRFGLDTLGKTVSAVRWDFGDGAIAEGSAVEHTYPTIGQHGVVVRAGFSNGERSVQTVFVDVSTPRPGSEPLVEADFEDATRQSKWGYHFKFYRRRLTGYAHVLRKDGNGKCIRLFMDPKKANNVCAIVAPGVWEIDAYPFVRFAYRIPPGTPVGLCVEPFQAPSVPSRILLGGTASRSRADSRVGADTGQYALTDDDQWHTVTIDVRGVREVVKDLRYLRLFQFHTQWPEDKPYEFHFDDFYILPEEP